MREHWLIHHPSDAHRLRAVPGVTKTIERESVRPGYFYVADPDAVAMANLVTGESMTLREFVDGK